MYNTYEKVQFNTYLWYLRHNICGITYQNQCLPLFLKYFFSRHNHGDFICMIDKICK